MNGGLSAFDYSIDQGPEPIQTSAVSLRGSTFRFSIPAFGEVYEGQLSADGDSITGVWKKVNALPLNFLRETKETAWEIPATIYSVKPMAADADPSFEVATIKPTRADKSDKFFRVYGQRFSTQNTSVANLIEVAYGMHAKQIAGAPAWVGNDKFDILATPDGEGEPSAGQWTAMLQKMLIE